MTDLVALLVVIGLMAVLFGCFHLVERLVSRP